ncbi:MAG: O-antigen ligase family protein [Chloroflexota bacterium]
MSPSARDLVQRGLYHRQAWVRAATVLGVCLALALPVGAVLGVLGGLYGSATLVALVAAYLMLRSLLAGLVMVVAIICLLPFAALPVNIGFSPTLLDLALVGVYFVWISRIVALKDRTFLADAPTLGVLVFAALALASFLLGLAHARVTANVLRHFAEVLMSILLFVLVLNAVRTEAHLRLLILALIACGFVAALVGIVLYALPENLTVRLLSTLRVVRYPSGSDVLRYIEDDPELPLRATSTSIDPNVLGGMLIFVATLTAAQAFSPRPILPRGALVAMLATNALCMLLTFSRGSFAGLAAAIALLGLLRHRRLLWMGALALALLLLLPPAQAYVQHFIEGVRGDDLATQMRFGEYKDALILIGRYPSFGVGFAGAPDIDTYLGVSNVYLLIAEEMGLVGLAAFLATLFAFLGRFVGQLRRPAASPLLDATLLGTCLAVVGGMVGGALDHYLFNLDFPHAAALMWLVVALGVVAMRLADAERSRQLGAADAAPPLSAPPAPGGPA